MRDKCGCDLTVLNTAVIQMIRKLEESGETAGTEAKSAILHGLAVSGRLEEALALYTTFKKEHLLPHSFAIGSLLVRELSFFYCFPG